MASRSLAGLLCAAALLAGCGGGDDEGTTTGTGTTTGAQTQSGSKPDFEVRGDGYRFTAPGGWKKGKAGGQIDTLLQQGGPGAKVPTSAAVAVAPAAKDLTLTKASAFFKTQVKAGGVKRVTDLPATKVGGEKALGFASRRGISGAPVGQQSVLVLHEGRLYVIGLSAPRERLPGARADFRRMLASWRFT